MDFMSPKTLLPYNPQGRLISRIIGSVAGWSELIRWFFVAINNLHNCMQSGSLNPLNVLKLRGAWVTPLLSPPKLLLVPRSC
jgi:hypothetical protein